MLKLKSFAAIALLGIAVLSLSPSPASAALLLVDGSGQLTGAQNVDVLGTPYDVIFVDGSCISLFSGCDELSDFDFTSDTIALAAAQALLVQVFLDNGGGDFDSDPELTFGCSSLLLCQTLIPYTLTPANPISFTFSVALNGAPLSGVSDIADLAGAVRTFDSSGVPSSVNFARFTPVVAIPEPSTLLLFGVGLAGLAGFGRRRRQD